MVIQTLNLLVAGRGFEPMFSFRREQRPKPLDEPAIYFRLIYITKIILCFVFSKLFLNFFYRRIFYSVIVCDNTKIEHFPEKSKSFLKYFLPDEGIGTLNNF